MRSVEELNQQIDDMSGAILAEIKWLYEILSSQNLTYHEKTAQEAIESLDSLKKVPGHTNELLIRQKELEIEQKKRESHKEALFYRREARNLKNSFIEACHRLEQKAGRDVSKLEEMLAQLKTFFQKYEENNISLINNHYLSSLNTPKRHLLQKYITGKLSRTDLTSDARKTLINLQEKLQFLEIIGKTDLPQDKIKKYLQNQAMVRTVISLDLSTIAPDVLDAFYKMLQEPVIIEIVTNHPDSIAAPLGILKGLLGVGSPLPRQLYCNDTLPLPNHPRRVRDPLMLVVLLQQQESIIELFRKNANLCLPFIEAIFPVDEAIYVASEDNDSQNSLKLLPSDDERDDIIKHHLLASVENNAGKARMQQITEGLQELHGMLSTITEQTWAEMADVMTSINNAYREDKGDPSKKCNSNVWSDFRRDAFKILLTEKPLSFKKRTMHQAAAKHFPPESHREKFLNWIIQVIDSAFDRLGLNASGLKPYTSIKIPFFQKKTSISDDFTVPVTTNRGHK